MGKNSKPCFVKISYSILPYISIFKTYILYQKFNLYTTHLALTKQTLKIKNYSISFIVHHRLNLKYVIIKTFKISLKNSFIRRPQL